MDMRSIKFCSVTRFRSQPYPAFSQGVVEKITEGEINTENIVRISDGTEVCSIVTSESCRRLALVEGDEVWTLFNSYSVVLLSE